MNSIIRHLTLSLTLCSITVHALPPDRPPCQDTDGASKSAPYGSQTFSQSGGPGTNDTPVDGTKCTVVKSCLDADLHILDLMPVAGTDDQYRYEGMFNLNPNGYLDINPGDHLSELVRMTADVMFNNNLFMEDVPVMTVQRHFKSGNMALIFNIIDPAKYPNGNDDSHLTNQPMVPVSKSSVYQFFYLEVHNQNREFSVTTWNDLGVEVKYNINFHVNNGLNYDNVTVTTNSLQNECDVSPKRFDFELNFDAYNSVNFIDG